MEKFSNLPLKGFLDEAPEDLAVTNWIRRKVDTLAGLWGYEEYDAPVLEPLELYAAKSSEELVREQGYNFIDRGEREVMMRPEITPSLARMVSQVVKEKPKPFRWYSLPKCYRYERPQKGRLREFKQLNFDLVGAEGLLADLEMLTLIASLMDVFEVPRTHYCIKLNHRQALDAFLAAENFNETERAAFYKLVDKRNKLRPEDFTQAAAEALGEKSHVAEKYFSIKSLADFAAAVSSTETGAQAAEQLKKLQSAIEQGGLSQTAVFDAATVRGLDYYTGLVFEVYDTGEGLGRALFGGGRYDNLLSLFSDERAPGIGFGMGLPIFRLFLEKYNLIKMPAPSDEDRYGLFAFDDTLAAFAMQVAAKLRGEGKRVEMLLGGGGLKKQFVRCEQKHLSKLVVIGGDEAASKTYKIKDLKSGEETAVSL